MKEFETAPALEWFRSAYTEVRHQFARNPAYGPLCLGLDRIVIVDRLFTRKPNASLLPLSLQRKADDDHLGKMVYGKKNVLYMSVAGTKRRLVCFEETAHALFGTTKYSLKPLSPNRQLRYYLSRLQRQLSSTGGPMPAKPAFPISCHYDIYQAFRKSNWYMMCRAEDRRGIECKKVDDYLTGKGTDCRLQNSRTDCGCI